MIHLGNTNSVALPERSLMILASAAGSLFGAMVTISRNSDARPEPSASSLRAMLALIVPGIILWLGWSMSVPVLIQERRGVFGSMSRSRALTKGNRWSLFGLFLILVIIAMVIQWGILLVFVLFGGILAQLGAALVQTVISMARCRRGCHPARLPGANGHRPPRAGPDGRQARRRARRHRQRARRGSGC